MVEYTLAPWSERHNEKGAFAIYGGAAVLCQRNDWDYRAAESIANAPLVSAAPDLLAAAKEIDRWCLVIESAVRNDAPSDLARVIAALRANNAAITKAEGQTQTKGMPNG